MISKRLLAGLGVWIALGLVSPAQAVILNPANTIFDPILSNKLADGEVYDLQESPYFWGAAFKTQDDAGRAIFEFQNTLSSAQDIAVSLGTVLQGRGGRFKGGVTAKWVGGESVFIKAGMLGIFEISKTLAVSEIGILKIIFGDPIHRRKGSPGIQMEVSSVSAVPLPPAALLLLSGLAGLGFLARKRKPSQSF